MTVTKTTLPVAGLNVHIHTQIGGTANSVTDVAVIFLLHGRLGQAQSAQIDDLASILLNHSQDLAVGSGGLGRDLVVISFVSRSI